MSDEPKKTKEPKFDKALLRERGRSTRLKGSLEKKQLEIEELAKENEHLKEKISKLEKELEFARKKSKPWAKPNKDQGNIPKPSKKKKLGAKKGHKANIRTRPDKFDEEVTLTPSTCGCCKGSDLEAATTWHEHWQIDVPQVSAPITTLYHIGWSWCKTCKKQVSAKGKMPATKYGPRLHATFAYWKFGLGLSLGKIQDFAKAQYGLKISTGQISEMITRCGKYLEESYDALGTKLSDQRYLHADETGWRVNGNNHWLWCFTNAYLCYYAIDKSRSQAVVERILGESFNGVLLADFCASYNKLKSDKQRCWAHLLRELGELKESKSSMYPTWSIS